MYRITVSKPSGFLCNGFITIYNDEKGKEVFYSHNVKKYFQLPKGTYYTNKKVERTKKKKYSSRLPKFERNWKIKIPRTTKSLNPDKASIYKALNLVVWDTDFYNSISMTERTFVFLHEIGHYKYKTEYKCDLFAAHWMLKLGFNPSQIAKASLKTLSRNEKRKEKLIKTLIKWQL